MKIEDLKITILQDTREQRPLYLTGDKNVTVEVATLWPGDYTVKGFEKSIAFERKSVSDLIGTMCYGYSGKSAPRHSWKRFDYELNEFENHYDRAVIIVEPDESAAVWELAMSRGVKCDGMLSALAQIEAGLYRSSVEPRKVLAFLAALEAEYGCFVHLTKSRVESAEYLIEFARRYVRARRHIVRRGV